MVCTRCAVALTDKHLHAMYSGAHALGQIDVDMRTLESAGVDYWMGNGHKWLYSPKGSAIMWVQSARQFEIVPTVVSSGW